MLAQIIRKEKKSNKRKMINQKYERWIVETLSIQAIE